MPHIELTLVIGSYAQAWHLKQQVGQSVTDVVSAWKAHWPTVVPMPHPSPRNQRWLVRNPWFETDVLPALQQRVKDLI